MITASADSQWQQAAACIVCQRVLGGFVIVAVVTGGKSWRLLVAWFGVQDLDCCCLQQSCRGHRLCLAREAAQCA